MRGLVGNFFQEFNKRDNALVKIILINIVVFLLLLIINLGSILSHHREVYDFAFNALSLPAAVEEFVKRPWTLLTYFFTHESVFHILFNLLFFYWFGRIIDEYLGSQRLVALYILGGITGALIYLAMYNFVPYFETQITHSRMVGASASAYAVAVAAATLLPNYTFHLIFIGPVKIKYIVLVYIVISLAQSAGPNAGGNLAHLGGAILGFAFVRLLQGGNDLGKPIYAINSFVTRLLKPSRRTRIIPFREKQVQHRSPGYYKNASTTNLPEGIPDQQEVDTILDKISRSGYESLTKEEKQKLFRASQQE